MFSPDNMIEKLTRIVILLAVIAVSEVQGKDSRTYLPIRSVDAAELIKPPPAEGSEALREQMTVVLWLQRTRTPDQVSFVEETLDLDRFVPILGVALLEVDGVDLKRTLDTAIDEVRTEYDALKRQYNLRRPFEINEAVKPVGDARPVASYPSGHAIRATVYARLLAEIFPEHRDALLELGRQIGFGRVIAGVHFPVDVVAGQKLGNAYADVIVKQATFQKAVAQIRHSQQVRSPLGKPRPVVIGALYNTTGQQRVLDVPSVNGARLAAKQANERGGILNRPIDFVVVNGESDVAVVSRKTTELIASHPNVAALMGASDTDLVLPAATVAADNGLLFLTSGATSPHLPSEVPEYLYLACFGDNVQAAAAAEWAYKELNARTASVVFDSEKRYTRLLQQYFKKRFESLGGKVNSVTACKVGAMKSLTKGLKKADIVFLSLQQAEDAVEGVKILREAGFSMPIVGGDGYDAPAVWAKYPDVKDVYFTTHAHVAADNPDPAMKLFFQNYSAAYPGQVPDSFAALGYDTVGLLIDAISRAGSDAPYKVREALGATTNYKGVTGTVGYETGSRIPRKSVTLISIAHGKQVWVEQIMPQNVPAP